MSDPYSVHDRLIELTEEHGQDMTSDEYDNSHAFLAVAIEILQRDLDPIDAARTIMEQVYSSWIELREMRRDG